MTDHTVQITCPHCRRAYRMKVDFERLKRVRTRASCNRCKKSFDVASRLAASTSSLPASSPSDDTATASRRKSLRARARRAEESTEESEMDLQEFADVSNLLRSLPPDPQPPPIPPVIVGSPVAHAASGPASTEPEAELESGLVSGGPASGPASGLASGPASGPASEPGIKAPTAPPIPMSWLDLADPGLADLPISRSRAARSLEWLLNQVRSPH